MFFSEEKNQKTLSCFAILSCKVSQEVKVFWFFFTKKNRFLYCFAAGASSPNPSRRNPGVNAESGFTPTLGLASGPVTE